MSCLNSRKAVGFLGSSLPHLTPSKESLKLISGSLLRTGGKLKFLFFGVCEGGGREKTPSAFLSSNNCCKTHFPRMSVRGRYTAEIDRERDL